MGKFNEKELIERITELRRGHYGERGMSKFASELGISPSTYFYYEQNRIPPIELLLKICELCGVGIYWLLTGQNEQNQQTTQSGNKKLDQIFEKIRKISIKTPASINALQAFLELMEQQNAIENNFAGRQEKSTEVNAGWIPVLGRTAAGAIGMWSQANFTDPAIMETTLAQLVAKHIHCPTAKKHSAMISADLQSRTIAGAIDDSPISLIQTTGEDTDEIFQFIDCPAVLRAHPDCFALQIDGDSMSPRINDGDIVILSPSTPAVQGQSAVVQIAGAIGATCKLFRQDNTNVHLIPINENYQTKIVKSDDILWAFAVLCYVKLKNANV
jgi:SOS-response transcriptional repressor LexA